MRILLTNDDGIAAPGLAVAEAIAAEIAGPSGEVWVVAPAFEQSGVSHCISYIRPMRLEQLEARRFAVEGSPADCVLAGIGEILDGPPDLVLSGVNRGHNVAEDTLYSGTIGGAMEGALHGFRAVAMSQYYGPTAGPDPFGAARAHGAAVVRRLLEREGPAAVTMQRVALDAGVSKVTVYRRFADRRRLLEAVVAHDAEQVNRALLSAPRSAASTKFGITAAYAWPAAWSGP